MQKKSNISNILFAAAILLAFLILIGAAFYHWQHDTDLLPGVVETDRVGNDIHSAAEREAVVETYIRDNLATLSPTPAVLGGSFYVTEIRFANDSSGRVLYEDGHIALAADFTYIISDAGAVEVLFSLVDESGE